MKLSSEIFNIKWEQHSPIKLPNTDIIAKLTAHDIAMSFLEKNYYKIFENNDLKLPKSKINYYKLVSDYFLFYKENKIIGFLMGEVADGESYYIRSAGLLEQYRGEGLLEKFYNEFFSILSNAKMLRVYEHVHPSNHAHIHILNKMGFECTGCNDLKEYGWLLQFSYFFK